MSQELTPKELQAIEQMYQQIAMGKEQPTYIVMAVPGVGLVEGSPEFIRVDGLDATQEQKITIAKYLVGAGTK